MSKRRLFLNATSSVGSVIAVSVILFILYRYLLFAIGIEQLGIWSLVLAATSITHIANFGMSGSVVKYVAKYAARERFEEVSVIIQTAALTVAAFIGAVLLAGYPLTRWILRLVVPANSLSLALGILPFAFLTFWIMAISSVFLAGLDGLQHIFAKNVLLVGGSLLYLILCIALAPRYGIKGVALARIVQDLIFLLCGWGLLKKKLSGLPLFPRRWALSTFKEIIAYGLNFQVISLLALCYDPLTKTLLSRFGGLSSVGYYEMASRLIQQLRSLIVSANKVLVPAFADLQEKVPDKIRFIYLTSYQLLFFLAMPLYSMIILGLPLVSRIWIGKVEKEFVLFGVLLSVGWFFNTLNVPAYFANLGMNELKWNVLSHVGTALLNLALGLWLGRSFGGLGVIVGWAVALTAGSGLILFPYYYKHRISFGTLLPRSSRALAGVSIVAILLFVFIIRFRVPSQDPAFLSAIILAVFFVAILNPLWQNPMRRKLAGWILDEMAGGKRENELLNNAKHRNVFMRNIKAFVKRKIENKIAGKVLLSITHHIHYYKWMIKRIVRNRGFKIFDFNPHEVFYIDPSDITFRSKRARNLSEDIGKVLDGDWDQWDARWDDHDQVRWLYERFIAKKAWIETAYYQAYKNYILTGKWNPPQTKANERHLVMAAEAKENDDIFDENFKTIDELNYRCAEIDALMKSIQIKGILPQARLNKICDPILNNDNIIIDIGRDGRFLFCEGKHRFAIARILGLKKIPVKIGKRHKKLPIKTDKLPAVFFC